ncbi:MAG: hypothetical protein AB1716_17655 [Planctomycetota bacterium]
MRTTRLTVCLLSLLALAAGAAADVVRAGPGFYSSATVFTGAPAPRLSAESAPAPVAYVDWLLGPAAAVVPPGSPDDPESTALAASPSGGLAVQSLSPADRRPGSLALVLSALAGLGAFQGARSIKKVHFSAVPDWYHTAAPQVGHATPLSLDFDVVALPVCVFDVPTPSPRPVARCHWADPPPLITQNIPPNRIPRGPPPA